MTIQTPGDAAHHHNPLVVQVRYLAASRPYIEPQANGEETVAQLKPRVLTFFGLAEGDVDGGQAIRILFRWHHPDGSQRDLGFPCWEQASR